MEHLHLHSSPPSGPPARKAMKEHHHRHGHRGGHSPPPHLHGHFGGDGHFTHKLRHGSFPPPSHCKKDKLRVKHPKHCKKVGKLHRKLMKAFKPPKGTAHHLLLHNVCPGAGQLDPAYVPHHPGCCLHNRGLSMMQAEMLAALEQHPPYPEAVVGHQYGRHQHPRGHGRHAPHGRHGPRVLRSEIRCGSAPPMSPARHEAKDMLRHPQKPAGCHPQ